MQNDMKSIEKDAEKEVDNEFHAADEQYIHPPNTTKLENEIKQLDKEFGEHVQHAIGVIVNRRSNESKIVGSQSSIRTTILHKALLVQTLIMVQKPIQ